MRNNRIVTQENLTIKEQLLNIVKKELDLMTKIQIGCYVINFGDYEFLTIEEFCLMHTKEAVKFSKQAHLNLKYIRVAEYCKAFLK